jgi:TolB-like protein
MGSVGHAMSDAVIAINLFGACAVQLATPGGVALTGSKHKALFALLATAPFGRRTRGFLQGMLWDAACSDGRQSLRRALADIKRVFGDEVFAAVLSSNNSELALDLTRVRFLGRPTAGPFLEGLGIREPRFQEWVAGVRANPAQFAGLFSRRPAPEHPDILPVVAVLPFRAITEEPGDVALGDWLAEETSRSLARSRLLAVISHLSSRRIAQEPVDLAGVRNLLGADFCLSGSLRRCGGEHVLDADFTDVRTGRLLWTRRFADSSGSFLAASGEGLSVVVAAIGTTIADEALAHVRGALPADIDDHALLIAGVALMHRSTLREFTRARKLIEEAARRAPHAPEVHAWLGKWHVLTVINGWSADRARDTRAALDCTARALDLAPDNSLSLTIDGLAHNNLLRRLDLAEARYDEALQRNPSESLSWLLKGALHTFRYEGREAVRTARKARRLSPVDPFGYFYDALEAGAMLAVEDYPGALSLAERSLAGNARHISTLRVKIVALACMDREEEARASAATLMRLQPEFSVASYMASHPCADFPMGTMMQRALLRAGIPQGHWTGDLRQSVRCSRDRVAAVPAAPLAPGNAAP